VSAPRDVDKDFPIEEVLATSDRITVYRSVDSRTGEIVVVKLLASPGHSETQVQRHRFVRAVKMLESHAPRSFPRVLAHGFSTDGSPFIVMKFVDGERITEIEDSSLERVMRILATVADSLEEAARKGVSHHNLSPENILVADRGGAEEAHFLGIGTAAYYDFGAEDFQPLPPETRRFVAPELLRSSAEGGPVDWRSDLYSFALITVSLLGGEVAGEGGVEPLVSFPDSTRNLLDDPKGVARVLEIALRVDPRQRSIGWADLHSILQTKDVEATGNEEEMPSLGATVQIPLDRLPKLDTLVGGSKNATDTDTYKVERPPVAVADTYETKKNVSLEVSAPGVLGNDSDPEDRPLTAILVAGPTKGTLDLRDDGFFAYKPEPDFVRDDGFTYKANNGVQDSNAGIVSIAVKPLASAPVAEDLTYSTDEGSTLEVKAPGVLASVTDEDGGPLKVIVVTQPTCGSLNLRSDG